MSANESIICSNDELSFVDVLSWLFTDRFRAPRYMKVKRMGITEILTRIWLFSESYSKQPTRLIIAAHNCHIALTIWVKWVSRFHRKIWPRRSLASKNSSSSSSSIDIESTNDFRLEEAWSFAGFKWIKVIRVVLLILGLTWKIILCCSLQV